MDDERCSGQGQEFLDLLAQMDDDAQVAMGKMVKLLSSLPKGAPLPTQEQMSQFIEQARLENIRVRLGGTVGQIVPFPTEGKRTDVKPTSLPFKVPATVLDRAIENVVARCTHISDDTERAIAIRRASAEEGAGECLSLVAEWLAAAAPELHAAYLAEFSQ